DRGVAGPERLAKGVGSIAGVTHALRIRAQSVPPKRAGFGQFGISPCLAGVVESATLPTTRVLFRRDLPSVLRPRLAWGTAMNIVRSRKRASVPLGVFLIASLLSAGCSRSESMPARAKELYQQLQSAELPAEQRRDLERQYTEVVRSLPEGQR